jgi:hypothetical protein
MSPSKTFNEFGQAASATVGAIQLGSSDVPRISTLVTATGRLWIGSQLGFFSPPKPTTGPTVTIVDPATQQIVNTLTTVPTDGESIDLTYSASRDEVFISVNDSPGAPTAGLKGVWIVGATDEIPKVFVPTTFPANEMRQVVYVSSLDRVYHFSLDATATTVNYDIINPNTGVVEASGVYSVGPAFTQALNLNSIYLASTDLIYSVQASLLSFNAFDPQTNMIVATAPISPGGGGTTLLYIEPLDRIYFTNGAFPVVTPTIEAFDPNTITRTVTIGPVAFRPYGIAYSPNNNRIYVSHAVDLAPGVGDIYEIDPTLNAIVAGPVATPGAGAGPFSAWVLFFVEETNLVYVYVPEDTPASLPAFDPETFSFTITTVVVGPVIAQSNESLRVSDFSAELLDAAAENTELWLEVSRDGKTWVRTTKIEMPVIGTLQPAFESPIVSPRGGQFRITAQQSVAGLFSAGMYGERVSI